MGFDLDPGVSRTKEKIPPKILRLPPLLEYMNYCLFPSTSVFGPFLVYEEHTRFLEPSPLVSVM